MRNRLAIVGIFYDGYYDMWEDFLELFSQNWPDCPYPVYIVNGNKKLEFSKDYNVTVLNAGENAEYSKKVQKALESIDSDYYLLLLEDFFIEKKLFKNPLIDILKSMDINHISYLRMPMPEFLIGQKKNRFKHDNISGFDFISNKDEYTVTCQPSIWKREFLSQCIGSENYNAWIFEGIYTYSKYAHSIEFLNKCRVCLSNPLGLRHGAVQGKILPNVFNDFKAKGYVFKNNREVLDAEKYKKHIRKQRIKGVIPRPLQQFIKKYIKSESIVDKYKEQIIDIMTKMGLE